MNRYTCNTTIISGAGAVQALAEWGAKRVFLVTDPFFAKDGTAQKLLAQTGAEATEIFDQIKPDPSVELAASGTALLKKFQPDLMIALGGGSAMDCAKAIAYFSGTSARLVAVPTTSGSGSEVTDFAILTHNQIKHPLVDPRLRPDAAILDSDLLEKLPPALIADAGFDVLSHAAEAFVAVNHSAFTDALAADAFSVVFHNLNASFSGNRQVRLDIHVGATMAGLAFTQAGLGLCHGLSHSLGGLFHIPHGRLNAILLPVIIAYNASEASGLYARLARQAGLEGSADTIAVRNLRSGLIRLRKELHLPSTLAQAGANPADVRTQTETIIHAALADPCSQTNPVTVSSQMIRQILEEVTGSV